MKHKVQMTCTVPKELSDRLLEIAKSEVRFASRSHIVTIAIEEWLAGYDAEAKK